MITEYIEKLETLTKSGDNLAKLNLGIAYYNGEEIYQNSEKAFRLFSQAANGGIVKAEYWLGICHYYGHGTAKDEQTAKAHFQKAAQAGDKDAQNALSTLTFENDELIALANGGDAEAQYKLGKFYCDYYYRGFGLPAYDTAAYWYLKAAEQNHLEAMRRLPGITVWAKAYEKPSQGMHERAINAYKKLAEEGDKVAQYEIAGWYMPADGFKEGSAEKSFYWYNKSAENGYVPALLGLAHCYYNGIGTEKDFEKTKSLLEDAGARGSAYDKYQVALHYNNSYGIKDIKKIAYWYERAAEAGHTISQYRTGDNYFYGRTADGQNSNSAFERDYQKAVYWYKKAADGGNREAKFCLAECYQYGYGVEKDYKKAVELFLELARCTHGYSDKRCCASAAKRIADCYLEGGYGIEKNIRLALNWYESAAHRDVKTACTRLGGIYMKGKEVERNFSLAANYYEDALFNYQDYCYGMCEDYDMEANARYGDCYYYGLGVSKDPGYAFSVYEETGENMSHNPTLFRMGRCYFYGMGVKKDLEKARNLWRSAAYDGDKSAIGALKKHFNEEVEED